MRRHALLFLSLVAVTSCSVSDTMKPGATPGSAPAFAISDGANLLRPGNPDFFFLPPMVDDPSKSPNFNKGAFNKNLSPTLVICELIETTEATVNTGPPVGGNCKPGGYLVTVQVSPPNGGEEEYHYNWKVPDSPVTFYKISVSVGAKLLGFADVETADKESKLKNVNTGDFVPLNDGRTLPIKFRIEKFALCEVPGKGPCVSQVVDLSTGGTVSVTLAGNTDPSGVTIPPQTSGGQPVITVQGCDDFNSRVTDLPTFGNCVRVTSDPPLPPTGLTSAATVFICDLVVPVGGSVASEAQEHRVTLHRLDGFGTPGQTLTALPHTVGCPVTLGTTGSNASLTDVFKSLAHGNWKSAGSQALSLLSPRPLYAFRRLDQGGGGRTDDFSDFQFALPAKMEKVAGDNQFGIAGATLAVPPKVLVTDVGGTPVKGARVTFYPITGSVIPPAVVVTGADGTAQVAWTIASGVNSLKASGHGIAGADNNGPRPDVVDPFQPIQSPFDVTDAIGANVTVLTGSQTFSATGTTGAFDFGSDGWTYLVLGHDASIPEGWPSGNFGGSSGGAAFGSLEGPCGNLLTRRVTTWPLNTDILVRKPFTTPAGTLTITVQIDNDAQVFLDGAGISGGLVTHDGCADGTDGGGIPPVFTVPVTAGPHSIAIHGVDRGVQSFLDVKVSFAP